MVRRGITGKVYEFNNCLSFIIIGIIITNNNRKKCAKLCQMCRRRVARHTRASWMTQSLISKVVIYGAKQNVNNEMCGQKAK